MDVTHCSGVTIVEFEQVKVLWVSDVTHCFGVTIVEFEQVKVVWVSVKRFYDVFNNI